MLLQKVQQNQLENRENIYRLNKTGVFLEPKMKVLQILKILKHSIIFISRDRIFHNLKVIVFICYTIVLQGFLNYKLFILKSPIYSIFKIYQVLSVLAFWQK